VTALQHHGKWHVVEYNIRIGVTSGPMILRLLERPAEVVLRTARDRPLDLSFRNDRRFGCQLTLAGYGYPFTHVRGPHLPLEVTGAFDCDVWWNEVTRESDGRLMATGQRIADVIAVDATLDAAIARAYSNIRKIRVLGSYYRTDIGQSLWPPGHE
jgi:phosphoribosylamine-glycine ligase